MANMLQGEGNPPPPDLPKVSESNSLVPMPAGAQAAPAAPAGAPAGAQQGAQQFAPPTREQTIAALRHFDKIKGELGRLTKNPELGKSDLKSAIIDGFTRLVSERMMSPAQAVQGLAQVPKEPFKQREWVETQLQQTVTAENAILDHFGQTNPHFGDVQGHFAGEGGNPDDHMDHMAALLANYSKKS